MAGSRMMDEQLKLVVAEDNEMDAALIARHLARAGINCTMHRVQTEPDFVNALEDVKPDVILSDYSMPQFDGQRALEIAGLHAPDTPFLFVSGTIGEQRAIDALHCGATDYVLKSNLARLATAIQRAVRESASKLARRQSEQQLRSSEEQLRATVDTSQDWIWEVDTEGKFRFCSTAVEELLGYSPEDLIGQDFRAYLSVEENRRADALLPAPGQLRLTGAVARWRTADGQIRWLERNVVTVLDESRQITGFRGTDRDITTRREQEARVHRLTRTYRMLSGTSSAILRLRNRQELLEEVCRLMVDQGGYDRVAISLTDPNAKLLRRQAGAESETKSSSAKERSALASGLDGEADSASMAERTVRSGTPTLCNDVHTEQSLVVPREKLLAHGYEALATLPILVDGIVIGVIALFSGHAGIFDHAEVEVLQELAANLGFALQSIEKDHAVHFLSYFDSLTGLAKRPLFCQRLAQCLAADSIEPQPLRVVVFDVQKLHAINDSYGRCFGDRLIENMADRLKHAYADVEKLAYFGSGTFAIALPIVEHTVDLDAMLKASIGRLFVEPVHINGQELRPSLRFGIASYPEDATSADTLVQRAEAALTAAREASERCLEYGSITHQPTNRSIAFEFKLAGALERNEFLLHYQPKINLTTGSIEGFEALLRWQDSDEGMIPPSLFIPMLERSGAMVDVGAWVLLQAAHDIQLWRAVGFPNIRVAVNISASQLRRRDFVAQVLSCVGSSKVPVGIDIELTESMLMQDSELASRKLAQLREAGVGVALDHFGTSSSSLPLLAGLPVNALKIDRSLVQRASACAEGTTLVSTIVSLARSFGMQTIAEGVETAEQLQMLRQMNCAQAQGYFLARPAPVSDVSAVIVRLSHDRSVSPNAPKEAR
jgi:PAS domain S-box-containing protein/diguanylate cyclase (GGDEF)-like protein